MTRFTKTLLGSAMAFALFAVPASAQVDGWDENNDAELTQDEFTSGFESTGIYDDWDTDDDNALSEDEFNAGVGDGTEEFGERFGEDAYSEWDEDDDGALTEDEFYGGVYAGYDDDENNVIEEPELGDLNDDIGDAGFWDV